MTRRGEKFKPSMNSYCEILGTCEIIIHEQRGRASNQCFFFLTFFVFIFRAPKKVEFSTGIN